MQLSRRFDASMTTVADYHCWFSVPFVEQIVDSVFDGSGVTPVVLWGHKDEGSVLLDFTAPSAGVWLLIVGRVVDLGWNSRFIEEGKIPLLQIDKIKRNGGWDGKARLFDQCL